MEPEHNLAEIVLADRGSALLVRAAQRGQKQSCQDCDHRDDNQQFDQREGESLAARASLPSLPRSFPIHKFHRR
jgi:hypothetical protein